ILLADRAPRERLTALAASDDPATRLAGVLAAGSRLTIPPAIGAPPAEARLDPFVERAFVIQFADARVDLREYGRLGLFTVADPWKPGRQPTEQEALFVLLLARLADADETVRLEAAHFLSILRDPRSEPLIARVQRESAEHRLASAPLKTAAKVWVAG